MGPEERERYESLTDIMASFALEGMKPTEITLAFAWEYVNGADLNDIIERMIEHHRVK